MRRQRSWPSVNTRNEVKDIRMVTKEKIQTDLTEILKDMTSEWDIDLVSPIGPETRLIADLGFESIDIVQFIVAIQERFNRRNLPFEELVMANGRYVDEIAVSDAADFLYRHLNTPEVK
jgi:acyl carrier protein